MKISVVVPARNEGAHGYVRRAVASLRFQDFPACDYEIIVVDNASSDNTAAEAKVAGADRVILEPRVGTNHARARGLTESRGEIVAFLDADNQAPQDWLKRIVRIFDEHPDVVAVGGAYALEFRSRFWRWVANIAQTTIVPIVLSSMSMLLRRPIRTLIGGNWAARRSVLDRTGIDTRFVYHGDDTATACALVQHGEVLWMPSLAVQASARHYEAHGTIWTQLVYSAHFFSVCLCGKPLGGFERSRPSVR